MIEKWLQFTCDECEDVDNSTHPNMTVAEFRRETGIVRRKGKDLCRGCASGLSVERIREILAKDPSHD